MSKHIIKNPGLWLLLFLVFVSPEIFAQDKSLPEYFGLTWKDVITFAVMCIGVGVIVTFAWITSTKEKSKSDGPRSTTLRKSGHHHHHHRIHKVRRS
jgi:hypothetical protein